MARAADAATRKIMRLLTATPGVNTNLEVLAELEQVTLPAITDKQIATQNMAADVAERSADVKYPVVHVYCEKIANTLREKFRTFSGEAHMAIEVRLSQDRLDGLDRKLQLYVDAVTQVLDKSRGDWGRGLFYGGGYEAVFVPVKHGGRNFIQIAKITFEVGASSN